MKSFIVLLAFYVLSSGISAQTVSFSASVNNLTATLTSSRNTSNFPNDSFRVFWDISAAGSFISGTTPSSPAAVFEFAAGGNHPVIVNLQKWVSIIGDSGFWNTITTSTQILNINATNTYSLSGKVVSNKISITVGNAFLLKKMGEGFTFLKTTPLDENRSYRFTNVVNDTFVVWVQPLLDTLLVISQNTISKYYGNTPILDSASLIILNNLSINNLDFDLSNSNQLNGMFSISGKLVSNTTQALGKASILLFSANQTEVYRHTTSTLQTNNYQLSNIQDGDYVLHVIMDGIPTYTKNITVNKDLVFNIELNSSTSINEFTGINMGVEMYPNPVVSSVTLKGNVSNINRLTITDLVGKKVHEYNRLLSSSLDLSGLNDGYYFVSFEFENGAIQVIKIVKQ